MLLCNRSNANSWSARLLRSPPLEHRWPGGEPGLADRTPGWPFRTMGRRSGRPPLRQLSFSRASPGLLNWELEHAKASGRRRQPSERSGQGRARRAGRQNGTQTHAAGAALAGALTAPLHHGSWLVGAKRDRGAGR